MSHMQYVLKRADGCTRGADNYDNVYVYMPTEIHYEMLTPQFQTSKKEQKNWMYRACKTRMFRDVPFSIT